MTRKIIVTVVALIYMIVGLLNFYNSLFPSLSSSGLFVIRVFPIAGGALAFYAGLSMFRLNEFGRKLVIILLSIRMAINALLMFQLPNAGVWLGVENRLGEIIYRVESPYAYQGFLFIWIAINLLTIVFLSHSETKKIFVQETIKDIEPDIIYEE